MLLQIHSAFGLSSQAQGGTTDEAKAACAAAAPQQSIHQNDQLLAHMMKLMAQHRAGLEKSAREAAKQKAPPENLFKLGDSKPGDPLLHVKAVQDVVHPEAQAKVHADAPVSAVVAPAAEVVDDVLNAFTLSELMKKWVAKAGGVKNVSMSCHARTSEEVLETGFVETIASCAGDKAYLIQLKKEGRLYYLQLSTSAKSRASIRWFDAEKQMIKWPEEESWFFLTAPMMQDFDTYFFISKIFSGTHKKFSLLKDQRTEVVRLSG